jgi:hypothetical protein
MENEKGLFDLSVDVEGKTHLREVAKWARFFAILGFISLGCMILFSIIMETSPDNVRNSDPAEATSDLIAVIIVMAVLAILYFFPCYYTLRFANKLKVAIETNDIGNLNESFRNLKITLRYLGVLTLIFLALFAVGMVSELSSRI